MITIKEVLKAQEKWANTIIEIGTLISDRKKLEGKTKVLVNGLYAFDIGKVLFKPTKAVLKPFRLTLHGAVSYFIGGNEEFPEDSGFALRPWIDVEFANADIILNENNAIAMGSYIFKDPDGDSIKAEYTFGYVKDSNGDLRINVHHSSVPYNE
ncbi:MAG: hypothetical protein GTO02_16390 [Candidatus Dadabacteria bacterium]|nr:hypothetical protein [Candidatus Dadabacteria bacterium]NIQ15907.1 hypothetical protein [Candidatus Dadabacteria bacterium]